MGVMMWKKTFHFVLLVFLIISVNSTSRKAPNIVIIVADDVGRNDFSLHGSSQIPTPNIDALAYNSIILNKHYSMHICTPSRAALLTGNHPIRSGMQGSPLAAGEPRALPISMPTLPQKLSELGYTTHLVGKWHLGHQNRTVTPLGRGFHTYLGYWNGFMGYFDYRTYEDGRFDGFDLHDGHRPARQFEKSGIYATDLFTHEAIRIIKARSKEKPFFLLVNHLAGHTGKNGTSLEVPNVEEAVKKFAYIQNPHRRTYAAMIVKLDESVGKIVKTLGEEKLLENTIIVFMSDNGAKTIGYYHNHGSNWPLRGIKESLFEGGVRNSALLWSTDLKRTQYVENRIFHISDWMPTLYSAAGGNVSDLGMIDGIDHWPYLSEGIDQNRKFDVLLNIDEKTGHEALISSSGRYKILRKPVRETNYYGDSGRSSNTPKYDSNLVLKSNVNLAFSKFTKSSSLSDLTVKNLRNILEIKQKNTERKDLVCIDYCLFDLEEDPTETTDIAKENFDIVDKLSKSIEEYRKILVPQRNMPVDPKANPVYCFDNYFTWLDPIYRCIT